MWLVVLKNFIARHCLVSPAHGFLKYPSPKRKKKIKEKRSQQIYKFRQLMASMYRTWNGKQLDKTSGLRRQNSGIRGRPFYSWEGGGEAVILRKISCKRLMEEKNCMQHKWNRKKILALLQARKKNVAKLFHHSCGVLQNPSKTATIPDNLKTASHSG